MRDSCLRAAALVAAALVGACDFNFDVGGGTAPTGVKISLVGDDEFYRTYECAAFQLYATAQFDGENANEGDVTGRVVWRSSNPGVIDVSNGDIRAEPGSVFPAGTVIARSVGTAVIRADYIGLYDEFSVTADPIGDLTITPALTRLAPDSTQTFALEVTFEDDEPAQDLSASAVWSLPTAGAPAALIDTSTVSVAGDPLDRPFLLEARLFTCARSAVRELQLGAVTGLRLSYEQPQSLAVPLGYTDEIRVETVFADAGAPPQNVSALVEIDQVLGDDDDASVAVDEYLVVGSARADRDVQYRLRYKPLDLEALTRVYRFIDSEILSLRVDPARSSLRYPDTLALQAYGLFDDGFERPVRREVVWTSLNRDLATVVIEGFDAGEVSAVAGAEGRATIEAATANSEGPVEAEADIDILRE